MTRATVFLSYSREDDRWKSRIADHLRVLEELGEPDVWSDEKIGPGEEWLPAIQSAMSRARVAILVISSDYLTSSFIHRVEIPRLLKRRQTEGLVVIPVIARPCAWEKSEWLAGIQCHPEDRRALSMGEEAQIENDLADLARVVQEWLAKTSAHVTEQGDRPPYIGIKPFGDEDADLFYGREALTQRLVERLRDQSFLAVVGPSGSGKSSLVRAGLLPALRRGALPGSEGWELIVFKPGSRPLWELGVHLHAYLMNPNDSLVEQIETFARTMIDGDEALVKRLLDAQCPPMLLVVDQFEEIFTRTSSEEQQTAFIRNLINVACRSQKLVSVVLVLRVDFFDRVMDYPELATQLETSQVMVSAMSESELWQAIREPATRAGLRFEDGLPEQIIGEMCGQAGALPLLQQALLELWKLREERTLKRDAYEAIGGVNGAIASWADSVFLALTSKKQILVQKLFVDLAQPTGNVEYARLRVPHGELSRGSGRALMAEVLDYLIDSRLLTTDYDPLNQEKLVEVAHEALFQEWPRLHKWLSQSRDSQVLRDYLHERVKFWERFGRDSGSLLRGVELAKIVRWSESYSGEVSSLTREYLDESFENRVAETKQKATHSDGAAKYTSQDYLGKKLGRRMAEAKQSNVHPGKPAHNLIRPVDLVLRVSTRRDGGNSILEYRLQSPSGVVQRLSGKVHRSNPLESPEVFHKNLFVDLERLREGVGPQDTFLRRDEVQASLANIGRWLYRLLFPKSMRQAYLDFRDKVQTLLVVTDEPWIPWEIVRPFEDRDDDFFCMQFEMGRWLAEAGDPVVVKEVRRLICLTENEPEGQAPLDTAAECEILHAYAGKESTVSYLRNIVHDKLMNRLREGFDLLHFVGHGMSVEDADGARRPELALIELADRPFFARELEGDLALRIQQDRPVVFFNSCKAGLLGVAPTGLGGWAQSWIERCGASAFLAPFLSIDDSAAREFAWVFYRELRNGLSLGESLKTARRELRKPEAQDNLAWLAYSLYGYPNMQVALGGEAVISEDVLGEDMAESVSIEVRDSPLRLPEHPWRSDRSPRGALLRAEYGVVPFHFRQAEIEDLENWCGGGTDLGIRLYTGAGGMGKTRLALEICRRLRAEGWQAGLVDCERPAAETWREIVDIGGPRLLVVDYAETRRTLLVPLLREIYKTEDGSPTRVLLLARAALDWWEQLKTEGDGVGDLLSGPATRWYTLQPLAFSAEDRAESYKIALTSFAERLGKGVPGELPEDLGAEHYKRALLLHMRALATIEGVGVKGEDGILDYILDNERRLWRQLAAEWGLPREVTTGIGRAMAAITLGGGVDDEQQAVLAMRGLAFFKDEKENVLTVVARLLRETYPGENRWIDPVMPDLLGEHLIMREMEMDSEELMDLVLGPGESLEPGDVARPENEG